MKVAFVTTPHSIASEIGGQAHALLPYLRQHCDVEVFVAPEHASVAADGCALIAANELSPKRFDHILYQLGDEAQHAFMAPMVRELGGTVVLHDWSLFEMTMAAHPRLAEGGLIGFAVALREGGVREARMHLARRRERQWNEASSAAGIVAAGGEQDRTRPLGADVHLDRARPRTEASRDRAPLAMNRSIVRGGDAFIVHTRTMKERILVERNAPTPVAIVPAGAERNWREEERACARSRLGMTEGWMHGLVLAMLRPARAGERVDRVLEALALSRRTCAEAFLTFVDSAAEEDAVLDSLVRRLGLQAAVRFTGRLSDSGILEHMRAADACVHLPGAIAAGAPSGVARALSVGRPVITGSLAGFPGISEACFLKVEPGAGEVAALARIIVELHDHPERRSTLEHAARAFVDEHCHWSMIAREYMSFLAACPAPRSKRSSLIKAMLEASERHRRTGAASCE